MRLVLAVLLLAAEAALAMYLFLLAWLLRAWIVDDTAAFRVTPSDCYVEAARRFGVAVLIAVAFGGPAYAVNGRWLWGSVPRFGRRAAVALAACIALAGAWGAVRFVIDTPYM